MSDSKLDKLTESQFHTVWTTAVGEEGYDKSFFRKLLEKLFEKKLIKNAQKDTSVNRL
jgi:hypothetical protein